MLLVLVELTLNSGGEMVRRQRVLGHGMERFSPDISCRYAIENGVSEIHWDAMLSQSLGVVEL